MAEQRDDVTGLVLAGGASTRMGQDKATLVVDGIRLVDRAVDVLRDVAGTVLVAARHRTIDGVDAPLIADADGSGPLAGIVAGLRIATTPLMAVLAVDMPGASAALFHELAARWSGEAAVAPISDGFVQPLHAVYATSFAARFADLLEAGERSPRRALETLDAALFDASAWRSVFAENLNQPEDLRRRPGSAPTAAG